MKDAVVHALLGIVGITVVRVTLLTAGGLDLGLRALRFVISARETSGDGGR